MRRWPAATLAACILLVLSACAQTVTKREAFPAMYEERPLSILVLPPINQTTAADAKEFYGTTLAEPLSHAGYYVFPIEVVTEMMKQEGAYDTETLVNIAPQKFKQYFGADAVLYSWITHWDTAYYVIGGNVTVGVAFLLKSTTTGAELWKYDRVLQVSTGGGTGGGLGGLIVQVVVTAIQTATTDYVPIARQANLMVLSTLPYGKYHPRHGQDQDTAILPRR